MYSWQQVNLRIQRSEFIQRSSIRSDLVFRNQSSDFTCFNFNAVFMSLLHCLVTGCVIFIFHGTDFIDHLFCQFINLTIAFQLTLDGYSFSDCLCTMFINIGCDGWINLIQNDFHLLLCTFADDFILNGTQLLNAVMTELQSFQHLFFTDFLCTCFNHVDCIFCTGYCQVECCTLQLFHRWVAYKLSIHLTDNNTCNRSVERNVGNT